MIYPCVELDIGLASLAPTGIGGMGDESPTPHKIEKNSLYSLIIKNKST